MTPNGEGSGLGALRRPVVRTHAARSDDALVRAVRAGDEAAFAELYRRHRPALAGHARRILDSGHHALDDVLQDVFHRAHVALRGREELPPALGAWLHRITHNRCIDELRAGRRAAGPDLLATLQAPDDVPRTMEERVVLREAIGDIAALPPRQRAALVAVAVEGRSHARIARELDASPQASRSLLSRARGELWARRAAREAAA